MLSVAAYFAVGAEPASEQLNRRFADEDQPFLKAYCLDCHNKEKQEAKLDLSGYTSPLTVVKNPETWEEILVRLKAKEMPPKDAPRLPKDNERLEVITWIETLRHEETKRNAGDPGPVLARRLNGQLETGRVLDFKKKGDDIRKLCSLYLSLMDKMGVKQERYGDAERELAGL